MWTPRDSRGVYSGHGDDAASCRHLIGKYEPASVSVVALLQAKINSVHVDQAGFISGDHYVIRYGLDLTPEKRNLPDLYYFVPD